MPPVPLRPVGARARSLLAFLLGLAGGSPVAGHGDDALLLAALSEEIARAPDAELFLRRGELFQHQGEWAKADADFRSAARLDPALALVDFLRARLWVEAGAADQALPLIERYVVRMPGDLEGRFLRGDVLAALHRRPEGQEAYAAAVHAAPVPRPEYYARWAKFLAADPAADPARVLAVLDEGLAAAGPSPTLVELALAVELGRGNFAGALVRIRAALARGSRRENWLVREGDVLVRAGRPAEAAEAYRQALAAIAELPERIRTTVPIEKLTRDARAALDRLAAP